jgi:DNA-binding NarL/FixJ family response regulator
VALLDHERSPGSGDAVAVAVQPPAPTGLTVLASSAFRRSIPFLGVAMISSSKKDGTESCPLGGTPTEVVRVLIIDDNRSFADLLASALGAVDGIDCVGTASSAADGFARVVELAPSVVLMDLIMPGLDGLAATRELARVSPGTAVAVVSAHSDQAWVARAQDAGAAAYITKGGPLTDMIDMIRTVRPGPMVLVPSPRPRQPQERPAPEPAALPNQRLSTMGGRISQAAQQLTHRAQTWNPVHRHRLTDLPTAPLPHR